MLGTPAVHLMRTLKDLMPTCLIGRIGRIEVRCRRLQLPSLNESTNGLCELEKKERAWRQRLSFGFLTYRSCQIFSKDRTPAPMKRLLNKFHKKNRAHGGLSSESIQHTLSDHESSQSKDAISISDDQLDRGKLDDSVKDLLEALDGARDITGKFLKREAKAFQYEQAVTNFVQRLSTFTNLVENIADAHPYSKMAFAIISGVANVIAYTMDVDQNMLVLFETLDSTYKFLEDTKDIENHASYKRVVPALAKQTVECAYFIRDYTRIANFWARVGKNVMGGPIKSRVQMYQDAFSRLSAEFRTHSTMQIEIAIGRILEYNQEIYEVLYIDSLPYAAGAGLNTEKQCIVGTRVEVLDEIIDWINDPDDSCPRLFWLAGQAGVGKSAIAHSIALRFKPIRVLGSFFCFDRSYAVERRQDKIFSTIARDLADMYPQIRHELAKIIKDDTSLRNTSDLHLQWKNFLFQPLHVTSEASTGPILIVIDGLDESGDTSSRRGLLKVLEKEIPSLPANVRILITSRPDNDIMRIFKKSQSHIRTKMMDTIPEPESKRDISTYLKTSLDEEHYFGDTQLKHLVNLSQGLFQWAYLASQFLKGVGNSAGLTVSERYEDLIKIQRIQSINGPLDSMYDQILSSLFDLGNPRAMARFHSVIGSIVTASEPLSLSSLVALRGQDISASEREADIRMIIQHMGSLLSGIDDPSSTIRPLHSSFGDYLLNPNRRKGFSIDSSQCHRDFAFGCIRTMMEELRFNICDIPDSHKPTENAEGLAQRIESSISIPLSYSSRCWASHVSSTAFDSVLAKDAEKFLHHGFLLWLEVMSLLKAVNVTAKLLTSLISWCAGKESHEALHEFAVDGKRFVRLFVRAIVVSAPHVYLSALPFCPQDSIIYKTFINQFLNTLRIASGPVHGWPLAKHGIGVGYVDRISFSHGGEYLAVRLLLYHHDTFEILDSKTFKILWTEKVPEDQEIAAFEFSPDDKTLVVATETKIYLCDILLGGLTLWREFESTMFGKNVESYERTVFSCDTKYIASVYNSELVVCHLETKKQVIHIPFEDRRDLTFEFSNNDRGLFVTYITGVGAQVWDLGTGAALHGPFRLSSLRNHVTTLPHQVSPNGKHIIFIDNVRLYVWNFTDDSLITLNHGLSETHGLAISPDGECLIAQSLGRITLRDLNGNEMYYDIDNYTFCTAFSKDGNQIAACDRGCSLNIWELDEWQSTIRQSNAFNTSPGKLQFRDVSSDGKLFLALSKEGPYEIWDVELEQPIRKLRLESETLPIFSPLNRYLGYVAERQIATIHNIHSGIIQEFLFDDDDKPDVQDLVFSKDEMQIATLELSRGRIQIWDITSSRIVDTITIPKVTIYPEFWTFAASSNFQYFAYVYSNEDGFSLITRTGQSIPLNSLTVRNWNSEDFTFGSDEEHLIISCGLTIFHFHLAMEENRAVALQKSQVYDRWTDHLMRRIRFKSSSDAVLVEIANYLGYNVWDAFSGQLLYSSSLEYPEYRIDGFIPVHQYLFSSTNLSGRVLALELEGDERICFSSNNQHSLRGLPPGSSARLRGDGWVVTQNNELLFWVPRSYHQTLHIPGLEYILGERSTELDLSSCSHGQSWIHCSTNGNNFE